MWYLNKNKTKQITGVTRKVFIEFYKFTDNKFQRKHNKAM